MPLISQKFKVEGKKWRIFLLFNIKNAVCDYSAAEPFVSPTRSFITTAV